MPNMLFDSNKQFDRDNKFENRENRPHSAPWGNRFKQQSEIPIPPYDLNFEKYYSHKGMEEKLKDFQEMVNQFEGNAGSYPFPQSDPIISVDDVTGFVDDIGNSYLHYLAGPTENIQRELNYRELFIDALTMIPLTQLQIMLSNKNKLEQNIFHRWFNYHDRMVKEYNNKKKNIQCMQTLTQVMHAEDLTQCMMDDTFLNDQSIQILAKPFIKNKILHTDVVTALRFIRESKDFHRNSGKSFLPMETSIGNALRIADDLCYPTYQPHIEYNILTIIDEYIDYLLKKCIINKNEQSHFKSTVANELQLKDKQGLNPIYALKLSNENLIPESIQRIIDGVSKEEYLVKKSHGISNGVSNGTMPRRKNGFHAHEEKTTEKTNTSTTALSVDGPQASTLSLPEQVSSSSLTVENGFIIIDEAPKSKIDTLLCEKMSSHNNTKFATDLVNEVSIEKKMRELILKIIGHLTSDKTETSVSSKVFQKHIFFGTLLWAISRNTVSNSASNLDPLLLTAFEIVNDEDYFPTSNGWFSEPDNYSGLINDFIFFAKLANDKHADITADFVKEFVEDPLFISISNDAYSNTHFEFFQFLNLLFPEFSFQNIESFLLLDYNMKNANVLFASLKLTQKDVNQQGIQSMLDDHLEQFSKENFDNAVDNFSIKYAITHVNSYQRLSFHNKFLAEILNQSGPVNNARKKFLAKQTQNAKQSCLAFKRHYSNNTPPSITYLNNIIRHLIRELIPELKNSNRYNTPIRKVIHLACTIFVIDNFGGCSGEEIELRLRILTALKKGSEQFSNTFGATLFNEDYYFSQYSRMLQAAIFDDKTNLQQLFRECDYPPLIKNILSFFDAVLRDSEWKKWQNIPEQLSICANLYLTYAEADRVIISPTNLHKEHLLELNRLFKSRLHPPSFMIYYNKFLVNHYSSIFRPCSYTLSLDPNFSKVKVTILSNFRELLANRMEKTKNKQPIKLFEIPTSGEEHRNPSQQAKQ